MQVAQYQNKTIDLSTFERSRWQELYFACTHGKVTCLHCHTPIKLIISIDAPPSFVHIHKNEECEQVVASIALEMQHQKDDEAQFIRLPKRRVIGENASKQETTWKAPEQARAIPAFQQNQRSSTTLSGYRLLLYEHGIELDDAQWSAVTTTEGPLLILAGAGSGKTRVLTTRAAYMLQQHSPREMILVTFTAKAAKEMKERMRLYPGIDHHTLQQLMIGTFHSIFYKMLLHYDPVRWGPTHLLKQEWQRLAIVIEAGREINLEEKEFAFDQALTQISWWKNHLLSPEQVKAEDQFEERCAFLYKRYEEIRKAKQLFDFDDMLLGTYELLIENRSLLQKYQKRFSYVSIDEFQDINRVQMEIIALLTEQSQHLCVVGDDDQSIYSFRGSDPDYILTFKDRYPHANVVILDQNYRSNHEIISVANNVISTNRTRFHKSIQAQHSRDKAPLLFFPYDEEEEATMIATDIEKQLEQGTKLDEIAILFRTNSSARAMIERFISLNIPFQIGADYEPFYRRNMIRKVLAFLRLALHPNDDRFLVDLIQALFLKQHVVQDVKALTITNDCTIVEALPLIQGLHPFQTKKLNKMPEQFNMLEKMTPLEAISFIETEMGFNDYLKKQGNEGNKMERGSDDIRDLKVVARLYPSIQTFLEHIDATNAKVDALKRSQEHNEAVQLLTIHRAKGLEYKTVYILGAVEGGIPHDYALEAWRDGNDKPLEEERRLMYVAMTRAIDQLYISVPMNRRGQNAFRSRFTREMHRLPFKQKNN